MKSSIDKLIEMQEFKDRTIAAWIMKDCCTGENLKMWPRNMKDPIDMSGECMFMGSKFAFDLEIKSRNKSEELQRLYPHATLRVDKYNRMKECQGWTVASLLYMLLQNEDTCFIFNLSTINWRKVDTFDWYIKKTEMDENSEKKVYPTYAIPYDLAFLKMDCTKYYQEYYKNYGD